MTYLYQKDLSLQDLEVELDLDKGFEFKPKFANSIDVQKITIYDPDLAEFCISKKFMNKYGKLVSAIMMLLQNDDSDDGDFALVLDELERERKIILSKYAPFLKGKKIDELISMLNYLEVELQNRYIYLTSYRNGYAANGR